MKPCGAVPIGRVAVGGPSPDDCLRVVLGSCIAICLWDPVTGIGGMNHFILPGEPQGSAGDARYGGPALRRLVEAVRSRGARHERLRAQAFGGADMDIDPAPSAARIGAANAAFACAALSAAGIPVTYADFGGRAPRRIRFWPSSGTVLVGADGAAGPTPLWPFDHAERQCRFLASLPGAAAPATMIRSPPGHPATGAAPRRGSAHHAATPSARMVPPAAPLDPPFRAGYSPPLRRLGRVV